VLICKHWSSLCLQNPPQDQVLCIELSRTTHATYLQWVGQADPAVQKVVIDMRELQELPKALLAQVLSPFLLMSL